MSVTSLRLSDKDTRYVEELKAAYNITNTSELIRVLIRKDHENLYKYEGLNLSDKQIITLDLYPNCITKQIRKEVN